MLLSSPERDLAGMAKEGLGRFSAANFSARLSFRFCIIKLANKNKLEKCYVKHTSPPQDQVGSSIKLSSSAWMDWTGMKGRG